MSGSGRRCRSPTEPSTMMASPGSAIPVALSISPIAGTPSARATMATWECGPPSSSTSPRRRGSHRARDENGVLRQALARGRVIAAGQLAHQTVGEVVEVVQAFAQEWIGLPQHPRARVGLDAFDRGLSSETGIHRFLEL